MPIYGVVGACDPYFAHDEPWKLRAEQALNEYVEKEVLAARAGGVTIAVTGDLNSFTDAELDKKGGRSVIREECLAKTLERLQLRDAWRDRHPNVQAYTHHTKRGAARLDATWTTNETEHEVTTLNAAIVYGHKDRTDHEIVITDLGIRRRHTAKPSGGDGVSGVPWKQVAQDVKDPQERQALEQKLNEIVAKSQPRVEEALRHLEWIREHKETKDEGEVQEMRRRMAEAHERIQVTMRDAIKEAQQAPEDNYQNS